MAKRWRVAETCPLEFLRESDATVRQLLWNRGIRASKEAADFLLPAWESGVHDAAQFRHMSAAVGRTFDAIEKGETITVHGDYDADGVTGSAVIISTLREIEKRIAQGPSTSLRSAQDDKQTSIDFYIPHRDKEGYGLHRETVEILKTRGTAVIITVDCGIACVDEIAFAKERGMDVIVIDHHQFGETLPDGHLIHPSLPDETYPFKYLAAVGVAYKFACALIVEARRRGLDILDGWEKWLLDLVAIATVTDMVPLVGENRVLETFGLRVLNKTRRVGLKALIDAAGLSLGALDTESVGFAIGPRINAAGRMDHASLALRLLLSESVDEAHQLALELERCNRERQDATRRMVEEAEELHMTHYSLRITPLIVLWKKEWSPSLVGLVAGRFAEKFARPVVAIGHHDGTWIGSGRSIAGYNITEAMRSAGETILTRVGGHPQACGFALQDESRLPELSERLVAHASSVLKEEDLSPTVEVDADIPLASITLPFAERVETLAPFGEGNRRPIFLSRDCHVLTADVMGSQKNHLRLSLLTSDGRRLKCIAFKNGFRLSELAVGQSVDLVYTLTVNEWNGRRDVELRMMDFMPCTPPLNLPLRKGETSDQNPLLAKESRSERASFDG